MNNEELSEHIKRLFVSEENRQRLLKELEKLDEAGLQQLSELVKEHDEEALKVLDEKKQELGEVSKRIREAAPAQGEVVNSEEEMDMVMNGLKEAFQDPNKLAELIDASDDNTLSQIEEVMLAALSGSEEAQAECKAFFKEVRLQKEVHVQADKKKQKELMVDAIMNLKEQNEKLDTFISETEKVMERAKRQGPRAERE